MVSRGFGRLRGGSAKKDKFTNTPTSLPHPTTLINSAVSRKGTLAHRFSAGDLAPPSKPSGLDQALKLIHPRNSKLPKATLKIAPSGAIVFNPIRSQKSSGSSKLPAEILAVQPTDSSLVRPHSTPLQDHHIQDIASSLRSSSFDSIRSVQSSVPRVRVTEYERQRRYTFLGRHPPPIQRRSASLAQILEDQPSTQSSPRQALFLGGPTNRPRPGYIKVPRFVPLEIRLNHSVAMDISPACLLCDQSHNAEGSHVVPCEQCGQRFSLDSSRSTRGGSEVPTLRTNFLDEEETLPSSDSMGVIQAVGNKFKAVFGKEKENKGHETVKAAPYNGLSTQFA
ncbi:MAG: hypothetical protein ASARMPREDX12_000453 [Alectoria sarmentosa]|nr:MAG: hypothetical protein ASARMPREDX12_000453 [Alectoria sarmentosa]